MKQSSLLIVSSIVIRIVYNSIAIIMSNKQRYYVDPIDDDALSRGGRLQWIRCSLVRFFTSSEDDNVHHPMKPRKKGVNCQLHAYFGLPNQDDTIMYCQLCHVHVCLTCWKPMHQIEDVDKLRQFITDETG